MSQSLAIATHTCAFRKHTNPCPFVCPDSIRSRKARYGSALQPLECKAISNYVRISIQALHARTARAVVYFVWDWFEAISQDEDIVFEEQLRALQGMFRQSVYGGPTVCCCEQPTKVFPPFICGTKDSCNTAMGKNRFAG